MVSFVFRLAYRRQALGGQEQSEQCFAFTPKLDGLAVRMLLGVTQVRELANNGDPALCIDAHRGCDGKRR